MSEQELYEIARQRIDQRNRRRMVWAIDLFILIGMLGVLTLASDHPPYENLAAALFFVWGGVFTLHTIWLRLAESRAKAIETEVARLREATYEKPKRLELGEDGELIDFPEEEQEEDYAERSRNP